MERDRTRQRDGQGAGDAGGHSRDPGADRPRGQREHHAAVRDPGLRAGGGRLHERAGEARRERRRPGPHRIRGELLRQPDRHDRGREARRGGPQGPPEQRATARELQGKVAIANAKLAYQRFKASFASDRWMALAAQGAGVQRLLWASTSTKNPKYRELMYVEELIGPDTVDTVPPATFEAFRHHGRPRASLEEDVAGAREHACRARRARHLARGDHRRADRRRRGPLHQGLPEAVRGDRRRAGATRARMHLRSARACRPRSRPWSATRSTTGSRAARCGACGRGDRDALDRRGRVATGSAGSRSPRTSSRTRSGSTASRATSRGRLRARAAARHGWLEPLPGGALAHLPRGDGSSAAAHPRLDRPRAGERARARARPRAHPLHRLEQVRYDARAEHLRAVLLRARAGRGRSARRRRSASSRSPIPDRSSSSWPRSRAFATSPTASSRSAGGTRPCRISAWCRAP